MKHKLFCILIVGFVLLSQSNNSYPQLIKSYGVKIGITASNLEIKNIKPIRIFGREDFPDFSNLKGQLVSPAITAWVKIIDDELLSLELEASYLQKGSSNSIEEEVSTVDQPDGIGKKIKYTSAFTFKYLQININPHIGYRFGEFKAYGILGPTVSYLLGYENFVLMDEDKNDILFGYNLGVGIAFHKVFIEAKYNGDFKPFYNVGADYWNKVFIFNLGVEI